jgi:hypothetical protein
MGTVTRINGWRVCINSNDHKPAHVHVMGPSKEVVFVLNCPAGPVELRDNYGATQQEVNWLSQELAAPATMQQTCATWRTIHGSFT